MDNKYGCLLLIIFIVLTILFILALRFASNAITEEACNNGICTECEMRYELKGVSQTLKYYACPECGHEVKRY